ncbi:MAG: NADH-quinone oxidoreductase subunit N [Chlorobi bacterium]|nr:NADH-quinone oxidoreductase subunit N [Chlorobiota bacterium]
MSEHDFLAIAPITTVAVFSLIVMLVDALVKKNTSLMQTLSVVGLLGGIGVAIWTLPKSLNGFNGLVAGGGMTNLFDILFCSAGILTVFLAKDYLERLGGHFNEFYTLLLMATSGAMLMAHATDFITLFVGVELMSICFYVLAGFLRRQVRSNEAAIKYFLLGAFASGFLLYGMALIYGTVGGTGYADVAANAATVEMPFIFWAGVALMIVGLAFKVAAFPFHQWAPDVYEGAPTVIAGFMSTAGKAAAFSAFIIFLNSVYGSGVEGTDRVQILLAVLAVGSMFIGNVTAIAQTNVKRMLAYSSVAHAGYMLIGLAAGSPDGSFGIIYYLIAYLFMQLGAFAIVGLLENEKGCNLTFDDYKGLSKRRPGLAMVMAIFMFSLTGIPPFAGFFGKYQLFKAAIGAEMTWLAICGVVASVISVWFYLGLVIAMFFRDSEEKQAEGGTLGGLSTAALAVAVVGTLVIGFLPQAIYDLLS